MPLLSLLAMPMQVESLEEKADVAPAQARAIVRWRAKLA
jgi:hypothetical protein